MWVWIAAAFLFGGMFGVIVAAVLMANSAGEPRRKWWEDEQR